MAIEAQGGEPFAFCVPPSLSQRVVLASYALFLVLCAAYIPFMVGVEGLENHPALWWVVIGLVSLILLPLRWAFPPSDSRPRVQVQSDSIRLIPGRVQRLLFTEPVVAASISPQSQEILLCHSFLEELPDGYRVIIRATNETEQEIRAWFLSLLDAQGWQDVGRGITSATALPVRLVTRRRLVDGTVRETPWIPRRRGANVARVFVAATIGALPYIGGVITGYFSPRPAVIVVVGLVLWLGQLLAAAALERKHHTPWTSYLTLYLLTTIFTFGAAYSFAVVLVAFVFRSR